MRRFKHNRPSRLVLALLLPVGLAACGSSGQAPSVATNASTGSGPLTPVTAPIASGASAVTTAVGTAAGAVGTTVAGVGDQVAAAGSSLPQPVGGIVTGVGQTVAATGNSLGNGALDEPVGVTLLNSQVTDTASNNLVKANVLSDTPPSNAPVQANVLANGEVVSASIANPGSTDIPVISPLLSGTQNIVNNATGTQSANPISLTDLTSPSAGLAAVGSALQQVGDAAQGPSVAIPQPLGGVVAQVGTAVGQLGVAVQNGSGTLGAIPGLSGATGQLAAATAPLNPLLNVSIAGNQLIGSPAGGAALTLGALSPTQTLNVAVTTPAGVPNPVNTLVSTLAGSSSPLNAITAPISGGTSGTTNKGLAGLSSVTTTLTSALSGSGLTNGLTNALTGALPK
jgi:hypothetical protein